ncbi:unnamed protein product, partial [Sphacelaria rigidula]
RTTVHSGACFNHNGGMNCNPRGSKSKCPATFQPVVVTRTPCNVYLKSLYCGKIKHPRATRLVIVHRCTEPRSRHFGHIWPRSNGARKCFTAMVRQYMKTTAPTTPHGF